MVYVCIVGKKIELRRERLPVLGKRRGWAEIDAVVRGPRNQMHTIAGSGLSKLLLC